MPSHSPTLYEKGSPVYAPYPFPRTFVPNRSLSLFFTLVFGLSALLGGQPLSSFIAPSPVPVAPFAAPNFAKLPLSFAPNTGQLDPSVRFEVQGPESALYFGTNTVTLSLLIPRDNAPALEALDQIENTSITPPSSIFASPSTTVQLQFEGANPEPQIEGVSLLPGIVNCFIGNDPTKWRDNVPTFGGIVYKQLYPGVDLHYDGNIGRLKGTYIVAPGVDPSAIRWRYDGASSVSVDKSSGNLVIVPSTNENSVLTESAPVAWQTIENQRIPVVAHYSIADDGSISFVLDRYDRNHALIIDPELVYSTYYGSIGSTDGTGITVDSSGNAYITGATPDMENSLWNAFVTKLSADGTKILYTTHIGGKSSEQGKSIAIDSAGYAYITGHTYSTDFPIVNGVQGSHHGATDAFVTKLSPTGSTLVYSTYLGGSNHDNGSRLAVDSQGRAYVAGLTWSTDFPTEHALYASFAGGESDAFVAKLDVSGNTLVFSTYLGGSNTDVGFGIAADGSGNAYVSGMTLSSNFPTYNALQPSLGGNYDAFITKLNPNGSTIIYSTYLGGSGGDCTTYPPCAVAVDDAGNAYVTGNTDSPNFILRNPLQGSKGGLEDVFITKIHSSGTQLVFSTYLGGSSDDWSHGLAIDSVGNVYVTGGTRSSNFPIKSPVQTTYGGGEDDAFVAKLSLDGRNLLYSTYLGGSSFDKGLSIATDSAGNAYIVGTTQSEDFPTVNALQSTLHGGENAFVTKISSGSGSPPDTTPPTGEISAPAEGSTVTPASESVRIAATASDNTSGSGIKEVEFQVLYDGQWHVVGVDTTAPYEVTWNLPANLRSQRIGFGIHITDNAGNTNMNLNGIRRVTFNDLRSNWVSNRAYLNQLALGPNGDQMCSMSSIAMVRAQAGLIGKDFSSLRDEANRVWNTGLRGPRPSQVANYLNGNGMQASVIWNQNKDAHWSQIKSEIDAGRPIILNSQPAANGGRLTIGGHYIVVVGYREAANPTERQIIAYDPYGRWTSGTSRYARSINSTSPDPPDGTVGRWVFYTFNDLGTIYSVTARRTSVAIAESEPGSPPDEINVADHEEIVTYVGDGQSYPIQVYLPTAIR